MGRGLFVLMIAGLVAASGWPAAGDRVRIKDVTRPLGARHNQLVGYGLVVGLDGTGDSAQVTFTNQAVSNLVTRFGINTGAGSRAKTKNAATVVLTADLPPFVKSGDRIDVTVSSLGDARSLQGGVLLQAPLQGADGRVYAVAQGPVSVGGFVASGAGAQVAKNHPTAGRIPNGALIEAEAPSDLSPGGAVALSLAEPDYAAAVGVAAAIREGIPGAIASAVDAATVSVTPPEGLLAKPVELLAAIGELTVAVDSPARVVVNERTGTIIVGGPVTIAPVAVAHGNLTVEIQTTAAVSQPPPLSPGQTVVTPTTAINAKEDQASIVPVRAATVDDLVKALNALHATPRDLIAILQALKEAGALHASLEVL